MEVYNVIMGQVVFYEEIVKLEKELPTAKRKLGQA